MKDWDDLYFAAEDRLFEELAEELGRDPTDVEFNSYANTQKIADKAQSLYEAEAEKAMAFCELDDGERA